MRLLFLFLLSGFSLTAQVKFKLSIGGSAYEHSRCVIPTVDKNYVFCGSNNVDGTPDAYFAFLDSTGIVYYQKTFGGNGIEWANKIVEGPDTNLYSIGYTNSFGAGGYDFYLIKLDKYLNQYWQKTFGGADWDFGSDIDFTADGNLIMLGSTYSYGNGNSDLYLIKSDLNGDTIWTKTFGGPQDEVPGSVRSTPDGGFIIASTTFSLGDTTGDGWILKLNSAGDTLWTKKYSYPFADDAKSVIETSDGKYAVTGRKEYAGNSEMHVYLFDQNAMLFDTTYGGIDYEDGVDIVETATGGFALVGNSWSLGFANNSVDCYFVKVTNSGGFDTATTHGDPNAAKDDDCFSLRRTWDGGYILAGSTEGFNTNGIPNAFIVKTDTNGMTTSTYAISTNDVAEGITCKVYPNPFFSQSTIYSENEILDVLITDLQGKVHRSYSIEKATEKTYNLRNEGISKGIYYLKIVLPSKTEVLMISVIE